MKEERMKILEMLQDGKITAEDAMKLLEALGDTAEEDAQHQRWRRRQRNRRVGTDIQDEVQERIREARETLRASMPRVKFAVREATRAIPDVGKIIQDAVQTASDVFSDWTEKSDRQHLEKAVRQLVETTPIQASDRLSISTPKGHIASEIWDRDEVQVNATLAVWGTDDAAVNAFAEQIDIQIRRESGVVKIRPRVPTREKDDPVRSVRIDFKLRHPQQVDLDVRARHGNITLPEIKGAATLDNHHGKTIFEGASGNVRIRQHHGDIAVQRVDSDLSIDTHHSNINIDAVSGSATVHAHHGDFVCQNIGRNAEIRTHHGGLNIDHIGGNTAIDARHGPVAIREIGGHLAVKSGHGAIEVDRTGGNAQVTTKHEPIRMREIGGHFMAENKHGSIEADRVGGRAVAKNKGGRVALRNVGSDATVENSRSATHLENIAGQISVRADQGTVEIENPEAGVMIQSRGGSIAVRPRKPIGDDYAIQNKYGAVELTIPNGSAVDVHGYVGRGHLQTDLPLSITGTSRTSQVVSGQLNGGGSRVAIELAQGNLNLRSDGDVETGDVVTQPPPGASVDAAGNSDAV